MCLLILLVLVLLLVLLVLLFVLLVGLHGLGLHGLCLTDYRLSVVPTLGRSLLAHGSCFLLTPTRRLGRWLFLLLLVNVAACDANTPASDQNAVSLECVLAIRIVVVVYWLLHVVY